MNTSLQCQQTDFKLGHPLTWKLRLLYQVPYVLHKKNKNKKQDSFRTLPCSNVQEAVQEKLTVQIYF